MCSVSHGRRQYAGESSIGTVVVERGHEVDYERAEGSDELTYQRRSLQVERQANHCSYEPICRREKKMFGSTEGQSESKRWHVEHGGRIMASVSQIAIIALLMIMLSLQRLPRMS